MTAPSTSQDRGDEPSGDRRWWRHLAWPIVVLVVAGAGMLAGGVPPWRAAAIAVGVALALWSLILTFQVRRVDWHRDVPGAGYRVSTPWEVPGLLAARESAEAFDLYLRPRLWSLAQDLLRRRGIDPASARARDVVGARGYAILTGADRDPRRTTSSVSVLCWTIARLAVAPIDGSAPPIADPALTGLAGNREGSDR